MLCNEHISLFYMYEKYTHAACSPKVSERPSRLDSDEHSSAASPCARARPRLPADPVRASREQLRGAGAALEEEEGVKLEEEDAQARTLVERYGTVSFSDSSVK